MDLEGRCSQRPGAAVRFRIGDTYDALSCILRHGLTRVEAAPLQIEDDDDADDC